MKASILDVPLLVYRRECLICDGIDPASEKKRNQRRGPPLPGDATSPVCGHSVPLHTSVRSRNRRHLQGVGFCVGRDQMNLRAESRMLAPAQSNLGARPGSSTKSPGVWRKATTEPPPQIVAEDRLVKADRWFKCSPFRGRVKPSGLRSLLSRLSPSEGHPLEGAGEAVAAAKLINACCRYASPWHAG